MGRSVNFLPFNRVRIEVNKAQGFCKVVHEGLEGRSEIRCVGTYTCVHLYSH